MSAADLEGPKESEADQITKHRNTNTHCPSSQTPGTFHKPVNPSPEKKPISPHLTLLLTSWPSDAGASKPFVVNQTMILSECDCIFDIALCHGTQL